MDNRIPPPLVAALFGLLMWFAARHSPGTLELTIEWRIALALLVALAGVAICLAGVLSFRRARTTVNPLKPQTASALVSSGVYRYTRNPMQANGDGSIFLTFALDGKINPPHFPTHPHSAHPTQPSPDPAPQSS